MLLKKVLDTAKVVGRSGYNSSQQDASTALLLNLTLRDLAVRATPLSLTTLKGENPADIPLLFLSDCYFIKEPKEINEGDIKNSLYEVDLEPQLFDCFVYGFLSFLNDEAPEMKNKYLYLCSKHKAEILNARFSTDQKSVWLSDLLDKKFPQ